MLFGSAQVLQGFCNIFLMKISRVEMQQVKIDVEQRAETNSADHGADADLPAEQKTGDDDKNFDGCAAQADRSAGFARKRHHERIARAGA